MQRNEILKVVSKTVGVVAMLVVAGTTTWAQTQSERYRYSPQHSTDFPRQIEQSQDSSRRFLGTTLPRENPRWDAALQSLDKNGDNRLSPSEMPSWLTGRFSEYDLNRDGFVDLIEQRQLLDRRQITNRPEVVRSSVVDRRRRNQGNLNRRNVNGFSGRSVAIESRDRDFATPPAFDRVSDRLNSTRRIANEHTHGDCPFHDHTRDKDFGRDRVDSHDFELPNQQSPRRLDRSRFGPGRDLRRPRGRDSNIEGTDASLRERAYRSESLDDQRRVTTRRPNFVDPAHDPSDRIERTRGPRLRPQELRRQDAPPSDRSFEAEALDSRRSNSRMSYRSSAPVRAMASPDETHGDYRYDSEHEVQQLNRTFGIDVRKLPTL